MMHTNEYTFYNVVENYNLYVRSYKLRTTSTCFAQLDITTDLVYDPIDIDLRDQLFGAIVRNNDSYPDLDAQYKSYNRNILYKMLKENDSLIYMGDSTDYLYEEFFNSYKNRNIGIFDSLYTKLLNGDINGALACNNAVNDTSLIDYNQKIVNDIYLNTFAIDDYNLDSAQLQTLYDIATNYTPAEGGLGVYIARYMLNIDIDYDSARNKRSILIPNNKIKGESSVKVYPNPASNKLYLEFKGDNEDGFTIDIYNYIGNIVLSEKISTFKTIYTLNTSTLKNGIYIYNISTSDKTYKGKFTIIK